MKIHNNYKILDELLSHKNMYLCFLLIFVGILISLPFEYANFYENINEILAQKTFYLFMFLVSIIHVITIKDILEKNYFIILRQINKNGYILKSIFKTNIIIIMITMLLVLSISIFWSSNFYFINCLYEFPMLLYNILQFLFFSLFFLIISNIIYYFLNLKKKIIIIPFIIMFVVGGCLSFYEINIKITSFLQIYLVLFNFLFSFSYSSFYLDVFFQFLTILFLGLIYCIFKYHSLKENG